MNADGFAEGTEELPWLGHQNTPAMDTTFRAKERASFSLSSEAGALSSRSDQENVPQSNTGHAAGDDKFERPIELSTENRATVQLKGAWAEGMTPRPYATPWATPRDEVASSASTTASGDGAGSGEDDPNNNLFFPVHLIQRGGGGAGDKHMTHEEAVKRGLVARAARKGGKVFVQVSETESVEVDQERLNAMLDLSAEERRWNDAALLVRAGAELKVNGEEGMNAAYWVSRGAGPSFAAILEVEHECRGVRPADIKKKARSEGLFEKDIDEIFTPTEPELTEMTRVTYAYIKKNLRVFLLLLKGNADLFQGLSGRVSCLHMAAQEGDAALVKCLVDRGGKRLVQLTVNGGYDALFYASDEGHAQVAKMLIEGRADVHNFNDTGYTALMFASIKGRTDVVKVLIDGKADVNAMNKDGSTALLLGLQHAKPDVAKMLIAAKADIQTQFKWGTTSLMLASAIGDVELVQMVLQRSPAINAANFWQQTALMMAAKAGHVEVVKILLACGADESPKNKNGKTALAIALEKGHVDVAKALGGEVDLAAMRRNV
eukprot:CAMPEP_0206232784 /NCGR_PEP_ID=MMETSP0047_2-20121206/11608_1 /ASSEMBLY_ACC=CAM_ASM_000192 /TAXON_ID=195065 /ORGANISM="Chroomonas mesostigmatica_cf, Strain CCMP1168" /LENGTH=547 /DNA_ID=CAMNT_0053656559 /DNA_START=49 /DNA_END=1692 /DNA_ORIENTATION=+